LGLHLKVEIGFVRDVGAVAVALDEKRQNSGSLVSSSGCCDRCARELSDAFNHALKTNEPSVIHVKAGAEAIISVTETGLVSVEK
jgi:hypothetical protein